MADEGEQRQYKIKYITERIGTIPDIPWELLPDADLDSIADGIHTIERWSAIENLSRN